MITDVAEIRAALGLTSSITDAERGILQLVHAPIEASVKTFLGYEPEQGTHTDELYPAADETPVDSSGRWIKQGNQSILVGTRRAHASSDALQLRHLPVRSITTLYENTAAHGDPANFTSATALTAGTHFYLDIDQAGISRSGQVVRIGPSWPGVRHSVMVTYVAGYSARELAGQDTQFFVNAGPIKAATILQIVKEFKQIVLQQKGNAGFTAGPLASERLGDYAYSTGGNSAMLSAGMGINLMPEVENMLAPYRHFGLSLVA